MPTVRSVLAGGLIGYAALHTQAAVLVDKVLEGRRPAGLPVELGDEVSPLAST